MQLSDPSTYPDRPPLYLVDSTLASRTVHDDLEILARLVLTARSHANRVLEDKRDLELIDSQRDALHLLALIDGLGCQVEHAAETLRRIERRERTAEHGRHGPLASAAG